MKPEDSPVTKLYVRIDSEDTELSTLNAINGVLKASGLNTVAQCRVLQYLLDRREQLAANVPSVNVVAQVE